MSNIGNAKLLGGIGAILSLIGWVVPSVGPIVGIVGLIMIFVAIKYISDESKDKSIFDNYLYSFLFTIIAIVAAFAIVTFAVLTTIDIFNIQEVAQNITDPASFMEVFGAALAGCLLALIIGWILMILGAIFLRKSYNNIAEKTQVDIFKTTGLVYFIGAITLIILVGILILFIAKIMEIIAFFSLPDELPKETKDITADTIK